MSVDLDAATPPPAPPRGRPSVATGSVARSAAEALWALVSLVTGVVVARHLGADGKGMVSSIGYLAALVGPAVTLGLGEAGVTFTRARGTALRDAVGAIIAWVAVWSLAGAAVLVGFILLQFADEMNNLEGATLAAVLSVPAMALWYALSLLVEAEGGLFESSAIKVLVAIATAVATAVLVLRFELAVAGAVAAMAGGFIVGAVLLMAWLWARRGVAPIPRWNASFLRLALPVGLPVQASYLLVGLAARVDLLIVQVVKGSAQAGFYSVALTMGQLVAYGPVALSAASFPVAAMSSATEVVPFIERAGRTAVAAGVLAAVVVVPVLPFIVPFLFGSGFSESVAMALVLLPGGILHGLQWVTCRLWAAQGRGSLLAISSGATLIAMVALALALVPSQGAMGAAIASVISSVVGAAIAVAGHRRFAAGAADPLGFVPRLGDFTRIALLPRELRRRLATGA